MPIYYKTIVPAGGTLPEGSVPERALVDVQEVATTVLRDALTNVQEGDLCKVTTPPVAIYVYTGTAWEPFTGVLEESDPEFNAWVGASVTAAEDLIVGTGPGATKAFPVGSEDAVLSVKSGAVAWAALPDGTTSVKGVVELATDGENAASVAVQGNDSRINVQAASAITALEIDWAVLGTRYKVLSASDTFTFANDANGQVLNVAITNTGAFVPTFPVGVVWAGGSAPTPTAGKTDIYTFLKIGSTIYGSARLNF